MSNCRFSVVKLDFRAHRGTPGTTLQETISMTSNQGCPVSYQPSLAAASGWRLCLRVTIYESMFPEHIPKSCPNVPLVLLLFSSHVATKKHIFGGAAAIHTNSRWAGHSRIGSWKMPKRKLPREWSVWSSTPTTSSIAAARWAQGGSRWCPTANVLRYRVQLR